MADSHDHDFNNEVQGGDIPWDHSQDMDMLEDILQYISADGSTVYPPTLKADEPQEANEAARLSDVDPKADRVGADILPNSVGTDSDPVNSMHGSNGFFSSLDVGDLAPTSIGNGPIAFTSQFDTIQAAINEVGGGMVVIDDTKDEAGITISDNNSGLTVWQPSKRHYINQPSDDPKTRIWLTDQSTSVSEIRDVSFIGVVVKNDSLTESDILTSDEIGPGTGREATRGAWVLNAADGHAPTLRNFTWHKCNAEYLNGNGITARGPTDNFKITNFTGRHLGFDGILCSDDGTSTRGRWGLNNCDVRHAGRHCYAVSGSTRMDVTATKIYGEDPWICGFDFEPNSGATSSVHLEGAFRDTTRNNTTGGISAGVTQTADAGKMTGNIRVLDPNSRGAFLKDELNIDIYVHQTAVQNPNNVPEIEFVGSTRGNVRAVVQGGGDTKSAIQNDRGRITLDAYVTQAYAASYYCLNGRCGMVRLHSKNPVQGGSSAEDGYRGHLVTSDGVTDLVADLYCSDPPDNASYAIIANGNGDDYNRYDGNIRTGYPDGGTPTFGLGSNTDTTGLIT